MIAVVPAHDEAATVADVVRTLRKSSAFDRVVVVDDGSSDDTGAVAVHARGEVVRLWPNRGKGQAMMAAVALAPHADPVAFFDADLVGLTTEHVHLLVAHALRGFDQVCGLQDYGFWNVLHAVSPLITGQRVVRRWVLDALPLTCWSGYSIETAVNYVVDRGGGSTCLVPLRGVRGRDKVAKVGLVEGLRRHARMTREILDTHAALERSDGTTCKLG